MRIKQCKSRSANYEWKWKATLDREQMNLEYKDKMIAELTAKWRN